MSEAAQDVDSRSKIYISYRRTDAAGHAERLRALLARNFGASSVITDVSMIQGGRDSLEELKSRVEEFDIVLVLIGAQWLQAVDDDGRRRLDSPNDFVRLEIELALGRQIPVVPVLLDGATMPPADALPSPLSTLTLRHAAQLREGPDYQGDVDRLIRMLENLVKTIHKQEERGDVPSDLEGSEVDVAKRMQAKSPTSVPFNLADYTFSQGSLSILNGAIARSSGALTSSSVLFEMCEQGRPVEDPQWSGDFLRVAVAAYASSYEEVVGKYRRARGAQTKVSPRMMPGLAWSLQRAQEIALQTTGEKKICGRHLLAALIIDPPQPYTLGSHRQLGKVGIDIPLLRQRLYEWVRGYGDSDSVWRTVLVGPGQVRFTRAEFAADGTSGPDYLDIEQDVLALATLVSARDTLPPLSIGLFGDWGSGKTFFMGQMRRAIAQLSKQARDSERMQRELPFYKRIIQIEFNAWHYVEGNLWASMVDHILDNLRISDEQPASVTENLQKHWISKLDFAEKAQTGANQKTQQAAAKVEEALTAVTEAKKTHDTKQAELQELSKKSAARDFRLSGALPLVKQALEPLGFKDLSDGVVDLQSSLREARSVVERGSVVLTPLLHASDRRNRWRSLLIILLAAPLLAAAVAWLLAWLGQERIAQISGFATFAAGLLVAGARWIRRQAEWMSEQLKKVEQAQRSYDEALAKELAGTAENIARAEQELALARQDYTLAQQRAERAQRERDAAAAELAAATTSRLLDRFIQDRAASSDYRKHLGVLAVVRQDFQQLSRLIEEDNWRLAPETATDSKVPRGLKKIQSIEEEMKDADRRINRIVLYIDDLDRCPPTKVVDVLQAVHLLLAFPLFVVVVAVDARWISRSLETRYRELLHVDGTDAAIDFAKMFGVARSEDYLEKIFQIPLWLRTMNANSARRMAQGLLRSDSGLFAQEKRGSERSTVAGPTTSSSLRDITELKPPEGKELPNGIPANSQDAHAQTSNSSVTTPSAKPLVPNLESLQVHDFEILAIDELSPLLGRSPRALKRFVNLYRLIKAGLTAAEHTAFVRQSEHGFAGYQAVLFLLAVDTGLPRLSRAVFDTLHTLKFEAEPSDLSGFIKSLESQDLEGTSDWATLRAWLMARRQGDRNTQDSMKQLMTWAPRVSRYSFQAAHIESGRSPAPRRRRTTKKAAV